MDVKERIQRILASKGLTLYQASLQSKALYGKASPYFLAHNLYYDLRQAAFTPSIYQVFALSRISGHRISDWLRVFGIDLENVPRIQALLPRKRTALIDKTLTDAESSVQWFRSRGAYDTIPAIAPLSQLLQQTGPRKIASLRQQDTSEYAYAKIGSTDTLAFPELLPGSIVRANAKLVPQSFPEKDGSVSDRIFLLEASKGLFCSRIRRVSEKVIVPVGTELSYAQVELKLSSEAKVLGVVDFEIRSLLRPSRPDVPKELAKLWQPIALFDDKTFHQFLAAARSNAGISYREAALESRRVSEILEDERYRIAASSICDYETRDTPPRGLHKIFTLCCIYGLRFGSLLRSIGIPVDQAGREAMPDNLVRTPQHVEPASALHPGFLEQLLQASDEVPFFLRDALAPLVGMPDVSIDDLFWIGGEHRPLNPYFANGILAVVNHRRKTPLHFPAKPVWKQPAYLLMQRDGRYLCACCDIENSTLVIHPYTEHIPRVLQFRHRKDIEVVAQIVAILRRLR